MARKCSHCGNYGHNSRTCSLGGHRQIMLCETGNNGGGSRSRSGLRLFGVQVHAGAGAGAGAASMMKKSYSMDCLHLAAAAAAPGCSLVSPSSSSSSSMLLSIDEGLERAATNGYLSDGPHGRVVQERKKGVPWSEEEHRQFLAGLEKLGKGDWRGISRSYVRTRTPTQVASHAQKFFLRQSSMGKKKRRSSLFDMVPICEDGARRPHQLISSSECTSTTSLSLLNNVPARGGSSDNRPAFDLNCAEEDDGRADFVSPASGAETTSGPLHPASSSHGHHRSLLELELGMSLSSTPSVGT